MILSSYERRDSPFVWIQFGAKGGKPKCEKTAIRTSDPEKALKISRLLNKKQAALLDSDASGGTGDDGGWQWVQSYLRGRYAARAVTLGVYLKHWKWLEAFLAARDIAAPAQLDRGMVFDYIEWRRAQVKQKSGRQTKLNTALGEVKLLGLLMEEAIARGLASEPNPARKLKIGREDAAEKPEITPDEERTIFEALKNQLVWMQRSFFTALNSGVRFAETRIARAQIRWSTRDVVIRKPKGGRRKEFTIPIYAPLSPLLREFWNSGDPFLWTKPKDEHTPTGVLWRRFFDSLGLHHLCFHCTRVTFITRGCRAGVPENVMCKMVNHTGSNSREINRIYQRWTSDDVRRYAGFLTPEKKRPAPARAATRPRPRRKSSRPE